MQRFCIKQLFRNKDQLISVLFIVGLVLTLLVTTRAGQQTRDSLLYAFSAKTGQDLFHPHHLIFTPAIHAFHLMLSPMHRSIDTVFAGQMHNILWATVGIVSFFWMLRYVSNATLMALLISILLLVTRGFWELSTQTTMYIPVTGILALLTAILIVQRRPQLGLGKIATLTLCFTLSVFYHQVNVLFAIPLGYYLVATEQKRGLRLWLTIVSIAGAVVLGSYIAVFLSITDTWSVGGFIQFCFAYTTELCFSGQCIATPDSWGSLHNFGGRGSASLLQSLLWNFVVVPKSLMSVMISSIALFMGLLCLWNIRQVFKRASQYKVRGFALIWMLTYTTFFLWWLPTYQHPLVTILLPTLLLASLSLEDVMAGPGHRDVDKRSTLTSSRTLAAAAIMLLIALVSVRNFRTRVFPLHQPMSDSYLEAAELVALSDQKCMALTSYRVWNHLRYHFNAERVIQAKYPLSYFYQGGSLPAPYQFQEEHCILISALYVLPSYTVPSHHPAGSNGYRDTSHWLAYITSLFNLECDAHGKVVASRKFKVLNLDEGGPYLFISPYKIEIDGLQELSQKLDAQLNGYLDETTNPFQSWLVSAYVAGN